MNIPLHIAEKLYQLVSGQSVAASLAKHPIIEEMVTEGVIERRGRVQKTLVVYQKDTLLTYLQNKYSINNLEQYISLLQQKSSTRSEAVTVSGNSKLKKVRTFKGFLINHYAPLSATLHGEPLFLEPKEGIFHFISDYEHFAVSPDITIVGIENAENFRYITLQKEWFQDIHPLFVSRYPQNQNKDLIKWLQSSQNRYLHFGDFDFAAISIYLNEYKKFLGDQAAFFVPENIEQLIAEYGNKALYDHQSITPLLSSIKEEPLLHLIQLIHKYKKGLEQELLINHKKTSY